MRGAVGGKAPAREFGNSEAFNHAPPHPCAILPLVGKIAQSLKTGNFDAELAAIVRTCVPLEREAQKIQSRS